MNMTAVGPVQDVLFCLPIRLNYMEEALSTSMPFRHEIF